MNDLQPNASPTPVTPVTPITPSTTDIPELLTTLHIAVVLLTVLISGIAYSSDKPNLKTAETKDTPNTEQRGSDTNPFTVKILPAPNADTKAAQEEKYRNEKAIQDEKLSDATIWLARITGVLAFFTGSLWWATYSLAKDAKRTADRQATEMTESLRIAGIAASAMDKVAENIAATASQQMRAYCTVVVFGATYQERNKNLKFAGTPRVINTGHTPAHRVGYRASAAILPIQLPEDFAFPLPSETIGAGVLGAGHVFEIGAVVDSFCNDSEVDNIKHGKDKVLYIWGIVTYADAFGNDWETWFCQSLTWRGEGKDEIVYGYYNPRHNKAT